MGFLEAVTTCIRNYFGFGGRASRSEYWYWVLFQLTATIGGGVIGVFIAPTSPHWACATCVLRTYGLLPSVVGLALLPPGLAVSVRRLHDVGRSGWWLFAFTLVVGAIVELGVVMIWVANGRIKGSFSSLLFGELERPTLGAAGALGVALGGALFIVGISLLTFAMGQRGESGANRFGPAPLVK